MPALLAYAKMTSEDHHALKQALDDALARGSVVLTTGAQPAEQQRVRISSTFSSRVTSTAMPHAAMDRFGSFSHSHYPRNYEKRTLPLGAACAGAACAAKCGIGHSANSRGKDRARSMAPTVDSPAVRGDSYLVEARMSGERRQANNRQVDLQATAREKRASLLKAQAWTCSVLRRLNLKICSNYPVVKRSFTDFPASSQAGQISDATF